ncbi:MAG: hypothetical protein JNM38_07020 [Acidobacteria bacterium]|nr:hypothetical protein [Acidobacteriota bacterium]
MTLRLSSSPSAPIQRALVRLLVAAQILLGVPVPPAAAAPRVFEPWDPPPLAVDTESSTAAAVLPAPEAPQVVAPADAARSAPQPANRHLPAFAPPARAIAFSRTPTAEEIFRARVLPEPLVPIVDDPSPDETAALARAIEAYARAGRPDQTAPFEAFLDAHPTSAWRAAVLANLAGVWWTRGAFSRALRAWDEAFALADGAGGRWSEAVAAIAMGNALAALTELGQPEAIRARLAKLGTRTLPGSAGAKVQAARFAVADQTTAPDNIIPSGLQALQVLLAHAAGASPTVARPRPGAGNGMTLGDLQEATTGAGLDLVATVRPAGALLPVPAIVHFAFQHYSAVVEARDGAYLLRDPALGGDRWIEGRVLDSELSGHVLTPRGTTPDTWRPPTAVDAATVRGYSCVPGGTGNNEPCPCGGTGVGGSGGPGGAGRGGGGGASGGGGRAGRTPMHAGGPGARAGGGGGGGGRSGASPSLSVGMASYDFKTSSASLIVTDTPVAYTPPRGPSIAFTLTYDYRLLMQPQIFSYANVGAQWSIDLVAYAKEEPLWVNPGWNNESIPAHVSVYLRGGGEETYAGSPVGLLTYPAHWRSRAVLARTSVDPVRYERQLPDGGVEIYGLADTAPAGERRVFLTEIRDAAGLSVTLTYDSQYRLVAVTDALGQVSTLSYELPGDPLKITAFADPFGRVATLAYSSRGQLTSLTDMIGMRSEFTYDDGDFIATLTTPYGTTRFTHETADPANHPWIQAIDPLGYVHRLEYHITTTAVPATVPTGEVPTGFEAWNTDLNKYVTFEWDARAWATSPGDVATATVTRWFLQGWNGSFSKLVVSSVPQTVKRPLEARTWYAYPGQVRTSPTIEVGWTSQPSEVARVIEGGVQRTLATYNTLGHPTSTTDPLGRTTAYTYATNQIDLVEVRQLTSGGSDLLAAYANYTAAHRPQTVADAAGQTTTLTYNAVGQALTSTNPRSETTTYGYDALGFLTSVTGPVTGATTSYTYDAAGRVATVTDPDGATLTFQYDALNRPTRTTYPDSTYEETTYARLDVVQRRDRLGRVTVQATDALGRVIATRDPAGRVLQQTYTPLQDQLIDAKGQTTTWARDVLGRVTTETRADGVTATTYTYQPLSGRLATVTDPKAQVTTYAYGLDDALESLAFTNATIATPGVSYAYDPVYARVLTMTDGTGVTAYTYHPAGQLGAGQVASVDGPLSNDTITYAYDSVGRVATRSINSVPLTLTSDALGRVTQEANALGTFTYGYDGVSGRLASVTYPTGQTSVYSYFPTAQDHRLQTIHHRLPDQTTLSRFDYTYDVVGNILTWQQQAGTAAPEVWRYGYDAADQLTGAITQTADPTPTILKRFGYGYDPAGNRQFEQVDDAVTAWTYSSLNRLVSQAGGGVLQFAGTINEPAAVTIGGQPAAVSGANAFARGVPVVPGTNTVAITATDPNGNTATATYEVDVTDAARTFTYDANGNLTSDGTRSFEWDARNQLVAVTAGQHRSEFTYDGLQRRVEVVERVAGSVTSDRRLLWCGRNQCETRDAAGVTVRARFFGRNWIAGA